MVIGTTVEIDVLINKPPNTLTETENTIIRWRGTEIIGGCCVPGGRIFTSHRVQTVSCEDRPTSHIAGLSVSWLVIAKVGVRENSRD